MPGRGRPTPRLRQVAHDERPQLRAPGCGTQPLHEGDERGVAVAAVAPEARDLVARPTRRQRRRPLQAAGAVSPDDARWPRRRRAEPVPFLGGLGARLGRPGGGAARGAGPRRKCGRGRRRERDGGRGRCDWRALAAPCVDRQPDRAQDRARHRLRIICRSDELRVEDVAFHGVRGRGSGETSVVTAGVL